MTVVPRRHLHRRTDPDTSRDAVPTAAGRQALCERLLTEFCRADLTSEEAALRADIDPWQASKRVSDLRRLEMIEPTGETRRGTSGRQQLVHRATRLGRQQ